MWRRGVILVVLALVLGVTIVVSASAQRPAPQITLASRTPVTVTGANFKARERVKIRYGNLLHVLRATSAGTFVTRFPISADPCSGPILISAVGLVTGDTATVKTLGRMCPVTAVPTPAG
jgi:hypothetical protein